MSAPNRSQSLVNDSLRSHSFAWFGQRALDSVGLEHYLNLDLVMCCDYGQDSQSMADLSKLPMLSLEALSHHRENWTSAQLDRVVELARPYLDSFLASRHSPLWVIAYSATHSLAEYAQLGKGHLHVLMPHADLKTRLDNKIVFADAIRKLQLRSPKTIVATASSLRVNYDSLTISPPFVAQLPISSSGLGTFFIQDRSDFTKLDHLNESTELLVRSYVQGISLNVNACVLGQRVIVGHPSIQLVGLPVCTTRAEVYCGNDFTAASSLPQPILTEIRKCVETIGRWLQQLGYRGMYGVDVVADLDTLAVYPVDLNPRYQNSTHLLTQNGIAHGSIPMPVAAIAWEVSIGLADRSTMPEWEPNDQPIPMGSQIILHSLCEGLATVQGKLKPGVYTERAGVYQWIRPGISLLDAATSNEFVLSCAVPYPGTVVHPGAPLLKVFSWESVYSINSQKLIPRFEQISRWVYQLLDLQPL